ncbi:MAG TPA: FAD-dependent monooxygenase [Actinocrinis sp.]|uniref:FAD-dependent monooxygenase n=1 Tax=Actinocrinis sp. TaxID=1920516 RepID=UPI002DDC9097|nr:FAD-dependent monooxygenase [Actinocrinis sp.]HEV2343022.1 FAD-dependent monooxygenase [Actinocrinis sp.]
MRIAVIGAGPAGCAAALALRGRLGASADIRVYERDPRDGRRGFGLVFPPGQLTRLALTGSDWARDIAVAARDWNRLAVVREGERTVFDGHPMLSLSRDGLLRLLRERLDREGVPIEYAAPVIPVTASPDGAGLTVDLDADLVVAADGTDSAFRSVGTVRRDPAVSARFVWFATEVAFPELTFLFRRTPAGVFTAHAYSYSDDESAFIVEAGERTWALALGGEPGTVKSGTVKPDTVAAATAELCTSVFAADLGGRALYGGSGAPREFAQISLSRWSAGRTVLIGDAAHTAHFSIGSGTSLALADAAALADAIAEQPTVEQALATYEARRRPVVENLQALSRLSSQWFATAGERMDDLDLRGFAESLVSRAGLMARVRSEMAATSAAGPRPRQG